jgi:hypothetical protein
MNCEERKMKMITRADEIIPRRMWGYVLAIGLFFPDSAFSQQSCQAVGRLMPVQGLPEASGVAASRTSTGVIWSHNDSGEPVVIALDTNGAVLGRVWVAGAAVEDWEDIDVGPCPGGSCLYIGDIGDNNAKRGSVTVYRITEPDPKTARSPRAESMRLTYPDGPKDAEALVVLPSGALLLVTKGERSAISVYRSPGAFSNGTTVRLEPIATIAQGKGRDGVSRQDRVTGAAASRDGKWIALRTLQAVTFHRTSDLEAGKVQEILRYDVSGLGERQGEGIDFGEDGTIWLASEGGGASRPGSLARLQCTLPND